MRFYSSCTGLVSFGIPFGQSAIQQRQSRRACRYLRLIVCKAQATWWVLAPAGLEKHPRCRKLDQVEVPCWTANSSYLPFPSSPSLLPPYSPFLFADRGVEVGQRHLGMLRTLAFFLCVLEAEQKTAHLKQMWFAIEEPLGR